MGAERVKEPIFCRPCERRDPYAAAYRVGDGVATFFNYCSRWLWVPAFAGTTAYAASMRRKPFHIAVAVPEVRTGRMRTSW
ncbi:hypothetical protein SAMN05444050_4076 [Afipia sp. GAS231]|nr:hypothetical protein SAMN05444050_4076 [Afipia sp. GAS231]